MESLKVIERGALVKTVPPSELTVGLKRDFFSLALHSPDGKLSVDEIRSFVRARVLKRMEEIPLRLDAHIGSKYSFCKKEAQELLGRINYSVAYPDDQIHSDRSFYMIEEVHSEVTNFLDGISSDPEPTVPQLLEKTVEYLRNEKEALEKDIYGPREVLDEREESIGLIMRVLRLNQNYSELYNKSFDRSFSDTIDLFCNEVLTRSVLCAGDTELISGKRIEANLVAARLARLCEFSDLAITAVYSVSFEEVASCVIGIRTGFEITSGIMLRSDGSEAQSSICGN